MKEEKKVTRKQGRDWPAAEDPVVDWSQFVCDSVGDVGSERQAGGDRRVNYSSVYSW